MEKRIIAILNFELKNKSEFDLKFIFLDDILLNKLYIAFDFRG